jgi:hypothetical protein
MRVEQWFNAFVLSLIAAVALSTNSIASAQSPQPVLQRGYDAGVTGANLTETTLKTSNVYGNSFGALFTLPVDDVIYAQPLYVPGVVIPDQGTHNVLYVATMSDSVYAFDADVGGLALWKVNLASLVDATPVNIANFVFDGNKNIIGHLGVLSTPVIDLANNILYVIACTLESGSLAYRLHALDIRDGSEPYGPGVLISASYGGLSFNARYQIQRSSLTLAGSQVIFGFSALGLESAGDYSGWVMAYDKLQQSGAFATSTTSDQGAGVWMSGRPAAVDSSGYIYVFTGNGYACCGYNGVTDFSETALKLDPSNGLSLVDWFTPSIWHAMDEYDTDFSASGPLLVPGTSPPLIAGGAKTGMFYLLNTTNLGKYNSTDKAVQEWQLSAKDIRAGAVYWQRSAADGGPLLFNWSLGDTLNAYSFTGSGFDTTPVSSGSRTTIFPGGTLTLSANGGLSDSGVIWATIARSGDAENNPPAPGELLAYNAAKLSDVLWTSQQDATDDGLGEYAKFAPPTVANGRVYAASWSKQVVVYGLKLALSPISIAFGSQVINTASAPSQVTVSNLGKTAVSLSGITITGGHASYFLETSTCDSSIAEDSSCVISIVFEPTSTGSFGATLKVNLTGGASQIVALTAKGVK